ncbi:DUF3181 domain-containing protein [Tumidithrix helvetica PCC 7403]|uniref:DUF3181 family protein n=1 Tax=Tumidithrix helvetica TaxID=3457545 RepID=UPI003C835A67
MKSTSQNIEQLAAAIAEEVYIDIAKWHLYLGDAHLHTVLAEKFYPMLTDRSGDRIDETAVTKVLANVFVKVGGGRREIPLVELIPSHAQSNLLEILEKFAND